MCIKKQPVFFVEENGLFWFLSVLLFCKIAVRVMDYVIVGIGIPIIIFGYRILLFDCVVKNYASLFSF